MDDCRRGVPVSAYSLCASRCRGSNSQRPRASRSVVATASSTWPAAASASSPVNPRPRARARPRMRSRRYVRPPSARCPSSAIGASSRCATMPIWRARLARPVELDGRGSSDGWHARGDRQRWRQRRKPPVERQAQQRDAAGTRSAAAAMAAASGRSRSDRPDRRPQRGRARSPREGFFHRCRAFSSGSMPSAAVRCRRRLARVCNRRRAADPARRRLRRRPACDRYA